jgi:hypothetical protein
MRKKRDLRKEKEILKPYLEDFEKNGIKVRIEMGDFKSDICRINGEMVIFLNRKLTVENQIKFIEDFKLENNVLSDSQGQIKEK